MVDFEENLEKVKIDIRPIHQFENFRLDYYLFKKYSFISRKTWQSRILAKEVLLNNKYTKPSKKITSADIISFFLEKREEPKINSEIEILFEDDYLWAVVKPTDLPVHPSGIYFQNTLTEIWKKKHNLQTAFPLFRLDRETSGIILLAKNHEASSVFLKQEIKKYYYCIVEYEIEPEKYLTGRIEGIIGKDENCEIEKKQVFLRGIPAEIKNGFKTAIAYFKVVKKKNGLALVAIRLITGRMHQIRAMLSSMGFPVCGDKLYGIDDHLYLKFIYNKLTLEDKAKLRIETCALHCRKLIMLNPFRGKNYTFKTRLPDRFIKLLKENELTF